MYRITASKRKSLFPHFYITEGKGNPESLGSRAGCKAPEKPTPGGGAHSNESVKGSK